HDEGVVGGRVAVDRDAVEGAVGDAARHVGQQVGRNGGVGGQKAQHGGHVGPDHAGALADARDGYGRIAQLQAAGRHLGQGVGGHDAVGGGQPVGGVEAFYGFGQGRYQPVDRQGFKNDAGGKGQHLLGVEPQQRGRRLAGLQACLQAALAGSGVGVAGIDHQSADLLAAGQVAFAYLHGGGPETVAGEDSGHGAAFGKAKDGQVFMVGLADAGFGDADVDTLDGVDF